MPKVLFSTLGMTDPIKNDHDGPFLHILRHYKPRKAYLFMTKRVCELADLDDRYRLQTIKLCEKEGFNCEIIELRHEEIDNPQQFDIFYPIFEKDLIGMISKVSVPLKGSFVLNPVRVIPWCACAQNTVCGAERKAAIIIYFSAQL
jgi:hypothetical protein